MVDANKLIQDAQKAQSQGNEALALDYFHQVLAQHPNENSLLIACGNLCMKLKRFDAGINHFRHLLTIDNSQPVINALCQALEVKGNHAASDGHDSVAETCFTEILHYVPNHAISLYNLGNAQRNLGKLDAATDSFKRAIASDPNDADVYNNLGNVQRELGQLDLAIAQYEKAIALDSNMHHSLMHLVHQKQHMCDWRSEGQDDLNAQILKIRHIVNATPNAAIAPFAFLSMPTTTAQEQKRCADQYVAQNYLPLVSLRDQLAFQYKNHAKAKLKIGYLSADFRLHPLAFLITALIEQHDRTQFEVTGYSSGSDDQTDVRKRLADAFDHFIDIRALNDVEAATKINEDQIDILVDLTGYTQSSRSGIAALKPAPIQINWLGFPGTMGGFADGTPLFDYALVDQITAPDANAFSEQLLYLPCYQPNGPRPISAESQKNDHDLPQDSFIFCCFNQTFKITPEIFAIWMRLLKQMPNSVLWLMACNPWAKQNLEKEAEAAGIAKERLVFAKRATSAVHIERQRHADLFLDTIPYNAHTTASDALWVGLPVLTCKGSTFSANVAASILSRAGMSDLICNSLAEYEEKALFYAQNQSDLRKIKQQLCTTIKTSDLFNSEKFARILETQYHEVWQRHVANFNSNITH